MSVDNFPKEKAEAAIQLITVSVVDELAEKVNQDKDKILSDFLNSKTGRLLFDESSKLWWSGPSDIVQMYLKEKGVCDGSIRI